MVWRWMEGTVPMLLLVNADAVCSDKVQVTGVTSAQWRRGGGDTSTSVYCCVILAQAVLRVLVSGRPTSQAAACRAVEKSRWTVTQSEHAHACYPRESTRSTPARNIRA